MSLHKYETDQLAAFVAARDAVPVWSETILFNGVGAVGSIEDLTAGNVVYTVKSPVGYKGKVVGVSVYGITQTFNAVTTPARVDVGISANSGEYYTGGSIGAASAAAPANPAGTFRSYIPSNSSFLVTLVAPTGGTPNGKARFAVTIQWHQE